MKQHILIVEDEPGIADTIRYALASDGFEPVWVATGAAALAALDAWQGAHAAALSRRRTVGRRRLRSRSCGEALLRQSAARLTGAQAVWLPAMLHAPDSEAARWTETGRVDMARPMVANRLRVRRASRARILDELAAMAATGASDAKTSEVAKNDFVLDK